MLIGSEGIPDASLAHLLRAAPPAVDYLSSFVPVARQLLKSCLGACAHSSEGIRVLAFVVVRAMAEPGKLPAPFTDVCMKGMYLTFVKNSRAFNPESYGVVSFLINQCVELCGVDLATAYQHVFVYVRQLAVYLRTALQSGAGEDAFRHVYNWQYVNSLRLWAMAVARYHDKRELYPLVYPICQIACGVVELFPSPKTFPLHLLVLGILNHLQRRTGVYVPTTMYLLRILSSPVFVKRFKGGGDSRPLDLAFTLRAKKADMANPHYHWAVLQETLYLLLEALALQAHCIGFPEFVYPVLSRLHKLRKQLMQADNRKFAGAVSQLSQRITAHRDWVLKRRKNVSFGPADTEKVAAWEAATRDAQPPLVQHYTSEKARREEQRKMKAEAAEGAHRKTIQEAAAEGESDDESLAGLAQAEDEDEASEEAVGDRELFGQAAEEITGPAAPPAAAAAAARPRPASAAGAAEAGAPRRKKRRRA